LLLSLKGTKYISKTIPGKLQTYLGTNKYIIGFSKGESAKFITKSKAGSIINPDRPDLLAKRLKYLLENKDIILKRENSIDTKKYIQKFFNKKIILNFLDKKIIRTIIN
jgi:ribosomal protein L30E